MYALLLGNHFRLDGYDRLHSLQYAVHISQHDSHIILISFLPQYLPELAHPYHVLHNAGFEIDYVRSARLNSDFHIAVYPFFAYSHSPSRSGYPASTRKILVASLQLAQTGLSVRDLRRKQLTVIKYDDSLLSSIECLIKTSSRVNVVLTLQLNTLQPFGRKGADRRRIRHKLCKR